MVGEAGLAVLLHQIDAHAARHEGEDRVGLRGSDLRQLGGEIDLPERREDLIDHLALIGALEPGERVLAGLIVRRQQEQRLVALVLRVFAEHLVHLVVLIGGDEDVRVAALAGER